MQFVLVIANPGLQGAGYVNIKRAAIAISHDVNCGVLFKHELIEIEFGALCKLQSGMPAFAGMTEILIRRV